MGSGAVSRRGELSAGAQAVAGAALSHPSPNFGPRRGAARPHLIVLHYTAMNSAEAALARLCDPHAEVSAHYLIAEDGRIFALVPEAARAWHAGAGCWGGCVDVNSASIGVELANTGAHPFPAPQMVALAGLLRAVMARHAIAPEGVIGHSDMAPLRKADPGARFDWAGLARAGLSVWPRAGEVPPDAARFQADLVAFGYDANLPFEALLAAFRLRFAPHARGPLTPREAFMARDLAARFGVDGPGRGA